MSQCSASINWCHIPAWSSFCNRQKVSRISNLFYGSPQTAALTGTGRIMRAVGRKARRARVGRIVMGAERASAEMLRGDGIAADCREMFGSKRRGPSERQVSISWCNSHISKLAHFLRPPQKQPGPIGRARGLRHTFSPPEHLIRKAANIRRIAKSPTPNPFPRAPALNRSPLSPAQHPSRRQTRI